MSFGEQQSPRANRAYIDHLIRMGHESVLEHVNWTFLVEGVSRAFTHQLVRHRPGFAYSRLSQQYHDEAEASFVEPGELQDDLEAQREWRRAVEEARQAYRKINEALDRASTLRGKERTRAVRSAARSVLPNATETKIVVTANARALHHLLKVRGSVEGDLEMRRVSAGLLKILKHEAPALFADFSIVALADASPMVVHHSAAETVAC